MKGSTFKRCGCRDPRTGRRLGQSCPQLRRDGGGWSRGHGHWHWQIELPPRGDGSRRPLRHGTYPNQTDANAVLDAIRAALAVPDPADAQDGGRGAQVRRRAQGPDLLGGPGRSPTHRPPPGVRGGGRLLYRCARRGLPHRALS